MFTLRRAFWTTYVMILPEIHIFFEEWCFVLYRLKTSRFILVWLYHAYIKIQIQIHFANFNTVVIYICVYIYTGEMVHHASLRTWIQICSSPIKLYIKQCLCVIPAFYREVGLESQENSWKFAKQVDWPWCQQTRWRWGVALKDDLWPPCTSHIPVQTLCTQREGKRHIRFEAVWNKTYFYKAFDSITFLLFLTITKLGKNTSLTIFNWV